MKAEVLSPAENARSADYVELTKPRISLMVVLTTAVGFLVAAPTPMAYVVFLHTLVGTALVASGASVLNQVLERDVDALMRRTANRPIPAGRIDAELALAFGVGLSVVGMVYLALSTNLLTALIGAFTLAAYVFVYTPMKRKSSLATIVGAVPGATPPMMGVAAATGEVGPWAWALFAILFLWQMPHFLAIAWMFREDYERGGFPMLTVGDEEGRLTGRQAVIYAAALVPVSLLPSVFGLSGAIYFAGALVAGLIYLAGSLAFAAQIGAQTARRLLLTSVLYLPVILLLMVVSRALA